MTFMKLAVSPVHFEGQLQPQEELLMTRRSKVWLVVAVLFMLVNLAGGVMAALQGEVLHAGMHAVLVLVGQFFVYRLVSRRRVASY
jgi:hypothetical protein